MSSGSVSRARQRLKSQSEKLAREFRRRVARIRAATKEVKNRRLLRHWEKMSPLMLALGACSTGNEVTLYHNGDDCFEAQWEAIAKAKRRVWLEMYTLAPDKVGTRMLEELTKAAQRGCKVILMVDAIGSSTLGWRHVSELRKAGGEVMIFNRVFPWFKWARLFQRDHRKILIVDSGIAFTGGMNVSELYAGKKYGTCEFDDSHLKLEGPGARDLAKVFMRTYERLTGKRKAIGKAAPPPSPSSDSFVEILRSDGLIRARRSAQRAIRYAVRHAKARCYLTNPYLVPPLRLVTALKRAAKRGVDVRIVTGGSSDLPMVWRAANHIYGVLLKAGVKVYEMQECKLHGKTMTVDGVYATVGTMNLDTWSDKRNLEVNVAMVDAEIAQNVEASFMERMGRSKEITMAGWNKRSWRQRMVQWWAYQVMRM